MKRVILKGRMEMTLRIFDARSVPLIGLILGFLFASCDIDVFTNSDGGHVANTDHSASADFAYQYEVEGQKRLRLDAINGSVQITGVSGTDSVTIWGKRIVESESTIDAAQHLEDLYVRVNKDSDEITVRTEQPKENRGRNYVVNYRIRVPASWQIFVEHINGNVSVSSIARSTEIDLVNGDVTIRSSGGTVDVKLTNGHMLLWDISGSVEGTLTNGNIDARILLPTSGTCALKTVNGMIDLEIPQSTSAAFSAEVTNGAIALADLSLQDQRVTLKSVVGTLGDGEGQIDLDAVNGNIVVTGF